MEIRPESVIESILRLMSERDLSQAALARKAKMTPIYLNKLLKGTKPIGIHTAVKLADALECTIDEIVGRKPTNQEAATFKDAVSILSSYERLLRDSPMKALGVRQLLGIDPIGDAHSESLKSRKLR